MTPDDAALTDLALAARDGDTTAAADLVGATYAQVHRMLVVLADHRVAEDLTQETFVRVFRSLPGFRAESTVRAWVLSIARRVAADHLRTARVRPRVEPGATVEDEAGAVHGDIGESIALLELLDHLEPDRRVAFVLTQVLELGYAEAAEVCACPVGTIRSRVARARADLAAQLACDPTPRRAPGSVEKGRRRSG